MNTAQRIHDLLLQAASQPVKSSVADIWSTVFNIQHKGHKRAAEVSARLNILHSQVELLAAQMAATDIPEDVFGPALRKVEAAISTQSLSAAWESNKAKLTPEVMLSLRYNAAILGTQESPVSDDELAALLEEVENLESSLSSSNLSADVLDFIERQLVSIKQALGAYQIQGASAIKDAVHKATGELIEHEELIKQNSGTEEVGGLGKIWRRFVKMGDAIIKADRALTSGQRLLDIFQDTFSSGGGGGV